MTVYMEVRRCPCLCFNIWGEGGLYTCIGKGQLNALVTYKDLHDKLPTVRTKKPEDQQIFEKIVKHIERTLS
jgi:hypothetical protein